MAPTQRDHAPISNQSQPLASLAGPLVSMCPVRVLPGRNLLYCRTTPLGVGRSICSCRPVAKARGTRLGSNGGRGVTFRSECKEDEGVGRGHQ